MSATDVRTAWREARDWLFDAALPLWAAQGLDPAGGFHDQIGDDRRAVSAPKRLRVQGRQMFVFAEAERLGWSGPSRDIVRHGLAFLDAVSPRDGLYPSEYSANGAVGGCLYDQAFVLLGLAHARRLLDDPGLDARAQAVLAGVRARLGRPDGGFDEVGGGDAPLQSNPHMHLYEACLAWRTLSDAPVWRDTAAVIRGLARGVFIDPVSGRLGEYFAADGARAPGARGRVAEPGHQFEWASLLMVDSAEDDAAAERLVRLASETGVDRAREVAFFSQDIDDGSPIDASARLWSQTERLRACLLLRRRTDRPDYWTAEALAAFGALRRYLAAAGEGLWRDRMGLDGGLDAEPAKASSLYHVMGAYAVLRDAAEDRI